ncbi:MAG: hypothetical protein OES09_06850, partial [Gammaproteobacteria bacterium]|nr:hypothetical protein [Gammaproteobacteria bacterium]
MGTNRYRHIVAIIISVVLGWGLMTTVSAQATSEPADDAAYTALIEQLQQRSSLPAWFSQRPSERTSGATQTATGVSARSIASKAAPPVCTPMTILTEDFEGGIPAGWTQGTNTVDDDVDAWFGSLGGGIPGSGSLGGADTAHSGSEWLVFDTTYPLNGEDSIVYFPLDLTTVAAPVELSFFLYMYSVGEPPSTFQIDVMRDTNGNGLPDDGAWQNEFFENTDQQTASNQPWVHITRSLNNYVGDKIIMRLRGLENAGATFTSDIEVDLLTITACPANTISGTFS